MSYSWYGRFAEPPNLMELDRMFRACDPKARLCVGKDPRGDVGGSLYVLRDPEGSDDLGQPLPGRFVNVYVPGKSAAGLEVSWDDEQGLRIRCMALASNEDHALALAAVERWLTGSKVAFWDEEEFKVEPKTIPEEYGAAFRRGQQEAGCATLALRVEKLGKGAWVSIQTPLRPFFVNADIFKRLKKKDLTDEVIGQLKRIVALSSGPSTSGIACPNKVKATIEGREYMGEFCVLGSPILLCEGDHVIVSVAGEPERLVMAWEELVAVLEKRIEWLDACQVLVPKLQPEEVSRLFEAAARKATAIYVVG
ncbi:MAG TPA: hypothetical protein VEY88_17795 [Archangium sp.]|nr:hypothetical protein [Archangium sp.]